MQDFYEPINRAGLLECLKEFLRNDDADLRAKACSAIGNMCRHSPYFYNSLVSLTLQYLSRTDAYKLLMVK